MVLDRLIYRLRQLWLAIRGRPTPGILSIVQETLSAEEYRCFLRLQPSEQVHAFLVSQRLESLGGTGLPREVRAAALLHDVGKSLAPLRLWERVAIVLGQRFFPRLARTWGEGSPAGWRKAFVVARQHPAWGAQIAEEAGSSPLTVKLIAQHQEPVSVADESELAHWLRLLQQADDAS